MLADPPTVSPVAPLRVLLVDDNADALQLAAMLLELDGIDVRAVSDGWQALAMAPLFKPHAVVLDIGMPGIGGIEVGRRLRADASLGHPLLIALTGYGQAQDRQRSNEAGFDHHLVKPVAYPQLLAIVLTARPV